MEMLKEMDTTGNSRKSLNNIHDRHTWLGNQSETTEIRLNHRLAANIWGFDPEPAFGRCRRCGLLHDDRVSWLGAFRVIADTHISAII